MAKRHRWEVRINYDRTGGPDWVCTQCGLLRYTRCGSEGTREYCEAQFGGRTWHQFAPPCPPDPAECGAVTAHTITETRG
jgi:hypothetical protein